MSATPSRHHLLIAGTGRAGTSFLVCYFDALGLDTTLSRKESKDLNWDTESLAGLEDLPVSTVSADLPYIVKSPWTAELVDDLLADPSIRLDAVILPMRNLVEAASSRTIVELRSIYEGAPWMAQFGRTWETWGTTPGGTIYSLNPLDQARLLAVGFHHLVHRLTQAHVPMVFLDFPRFANDADYLYDRLRPVLPERVTLESARAAHAATAEPETKVRVGAELAQMSRKPVSLMSGPSLDELDRIALARELKRRIREVDALKARLRQGALRSWIERIGQRLRRRTAAKPR
jgi:hypothetical protein